MNRTARAERSRERRRVLIALLLAVFIHFVLAIVVALVFAMTAIVAPRPAPPPVPEPVEITLLPPPPEAKKQERDFIDSSQNTVAEKAPENAQFESDQNSIAASPGPSTGNQPVPSVEGDERDGRALRNQALTLGPSKVPAPPAPQPRKPQTEPGKPEQRTADEKPAPTPLPTPKPEDDLALLKPVKPRPTPQKEVRKAEPPTPQTVPRPPGFQPQTHTTRLTGGISNRGRASIEAVATPLGRYKKMMSDAIGSRWYYYVSEMLDMVNVGTVKITFVVNADGHVEKVRVTQNTSNQSLANCSVRSIVEAEIPPIPREIAKTLESGSLEVDYTFTIVPP